MGRNAIKKNNKSKMLLSVLTFLFIFLLCLVLPKSANATNEGKSQNYFFIKAITNTVALFNSPSNGEQDTNSEIKYSILSFLGIDTSNPISIITKEIAYLDKNKVSANVNNEGDDINSIVPFKLVENQVSKSKDPDVVANLINNDLKQTLNKSKPRVLIYHSHTTEAYRTSEKDTSKTAFNADETLNVCAVGDVITEQLESKYGISVIHDKTVNNVPDYNSAYKNSGVNLDKYLKKYGDFDLIIDLHRDGVPTSSNNVLKTKINGEDVAEFLFVVTRQNPRYAKQKKLVDSMVGVSNKLFPNLLDPREIYYADWGINFYNQGRSNNALLVEVGNNNNTISQVKNTGMYLSRIFAEQLNGKK
ncbi:stage II sporulation protein P [Clostridium estertheticum]|uniref:stage II sporulation protein P n=1 Tax=Clostridium estertheticum TaxID=238834 RepID=UPI001C7D3D27|nr:stage II sporulation protein P [Clostridium estertheticum]MBX4264866.1 stage II sporulation protein P [Clostridium estertheticum]WLC88345.1 stage II sporulation protein P [Clostridium estertheticum]